MTWEERGVTKPSTCDHTLPAPTHPISPLAIPVVLYQLLNPQWELTEGRKPRSLPLEPVSSTWQSG